MIITLIIGVNFDEQVGTHILSFHSLSPPSFSPPLPWSGGLGMLPPPNFLFLLCRRWVLKHFGAAKAWFLVKGFVMRNYWKCMWRAYFLPSLAPIVPSLLPSLVPVPLLQSILHDVKITEQINNTRKYKEACIDKLNIEQAIEYKRLWKLWNALPNDVKPTLSTDTLRQLPKTHLFKVVYC